MGISLHIPIRHECMNTGKYNYIQVGKHFCCIYKLFILADYALLILCMIVAIFFYQPMLINGYV